MSGMVYAQASGTQRRPVSGIAPPEVGSGTIRLVTPCTTADDFVARFARHAGETTMFVVTRTVLRVGLERPFVFQLADATPVLEGRARVIDVSPGDGAGRRRGMMLELLEMSEASRALHRAMVASRSPTRSTAPPPIPRLPSLGKLPLPSPPAERFATATPIPTPIEQRTPGSPFILPANPLCELSDETLCSFVECTLYEDGDTAPVSPPAPAAETPRADTATELLQIRTGSRYQLPAVAALSLVLGLGGGYALGARGEAIAAVAPAPARAAPPAPIAVVAPPAAGSPSEPPAAPVVPPAVEAAPVAAAAPAVGCTAHITTTAQDVEVAWNGQPLGATPLEEVAVPCGAAEVVLTHPRYQRAVRDVDARPGETAAIEVEMERPVGLLTLRSHPAGATFTVEGVAVGAGRNAVKVRAYSHVDVTATLAGRKPWTKRVYVRGVASSVVAELAPLDRPRRGSGSSRSR
jgi:hypothetical protein